MKLAPLFTDNMVLQQGMPLPVWGTAEAGGTIAVCFAGQEERAIADTGGQWRVTLKPLAASAEPRTMRITSSGAKEAVTLSNVLVGEVWVCSGQSNMEWSLNNAQNRDAEIAEARFPEVRLFTVPSLIAMQPQTEFSGAAWQVCSPETAPGFSAVGYFFGRELHRRLGVPIGLINSSWGGTVAEAWTSREGLLLGSPELRKIVEELERNGPALEAQRMECQRLTSEIEARTADTQNLGFPKGWADFPSPGGKWCDMEIPGLWQKRGVPFSGILWFRKEIEIPAAWAGRDLQLAIGAADKSDTTYFNNEKVGGLSMQEDPNAWSVQRVYPVPGRLVKAGRNVIAVRVHSNIHDGGLNGPAAAMRLTCPSLPAAEPLPLAGIWHYAIEADYGLVQLPPQPFGPDNPNTPCGLFNAKIAPLVPYAVRGAIWYQGESNSSRPEQYRELFPVLIHDWRRVWGQPDFAFYFVQLANYTPAPVERWPELREAQTLTLAVPHTGMAVAIDIGAPEDVHPRNKQDVGLRLALNALHQTYGQADVIPCGPLYKAATREGSSIRIAFHHTAGGLCAKGERLQGFEIAGEDRQFVGAEARIEGAAVVVASPEVPVPVAVRYAWAANPVCNLYNSAGLPASPFRTEN